MEVKTIHMLIEQRIILLVEKGLAGHADDLGLGVGIGMLNEINNGRDGIADDLAFGPAECGSEGLQSGPFFVGELYADGLKRNHNQLKFFV